MSDEKREQVERSLERYRPGIKAGGADLVVGQFLGETVVVQLVIGPETCRECLIPDDILEQILNTAVKEDVPEIGRVQLQVVSTGGDHYSSHHSGSDTNLSLGVNE